MGTKNKPGAYDCYANAHPDEPMFVLLGRDPFAPDLVEYWANIREHKRGPSEKVEEARSCAKAMRRWQDLEQRAGADERPAKVLPRCSNSDRHDPKDGPVLVTIHYFKPTSGKWYCDDEDVEWTPDPDHYNGWTPFEKLVRLRDMTAVCLETPLGCPQSLPGDLTMWSERARR